MKKFFVGLCIMAAGLVLASCNKKQDVKVDGDAGTEAPAAVEQVIDFNKVLEQAKAEGAKWDVDQWKEAFTNFLKGTKPALEKLAGIMEKAKAADNGSEADKAAAALEVVGAQEEFQGVMAAQEEFEATAKASEAGKQVLDDEEWGNKVLEELGLAKLFETIQSAQ